MRRRIHACHMSSMVSTLYISPLERESARERDRERKRDWEKEREIDWLIEGERERRTREREREIEKEREREREKEKLKQNWYKRRGLLGSMRHSTKNYYQKGSFFV
jgi:hypothetical protein